MQFHQWYATGVTASAFIYLYAVTFIPVASAGAEHSKTIVGFLLGTAISTLINFFFGSSTKGNNGRGEEK